MPKQKSMLSSIYPCHHFENTLKNKPMVNTGWDLGVIENFNTLLEGAKQMKTYFTNELN